MKIKFFFIFIILLASKVVGSEEHQYCPKLYQYLWPDFCCEHLKKDTEVCSELKINKEYPQVKNLEQKSAEVSLDKSLINEVEGFFYYIPKKNQYCDYIYCKNCNKPLVRSFGEGTIYDEEIVEGRDDSTGITLSKKIYFPEKYDILCYQCCCSYYWKNIENKGRIKSKNWNPCSNLAIPCCYFNNYTKQYFHFFKQYLLYCKGNDQCICYWPYVSKKACEISDSIFKEMSYVLENTNLKYLKNQINFQQTFSCLQKESNDRMIHSLFVHAFFYSQYRQIFLDICKFIDANFLFESKDLNKIYDIIDIVQPLFLNLYSECIEKHPHPKIFYERGMIYFQQGKNLEALNDIGEFINFAEKNDFKDLLTSDLYFQEGKSYAELGIYDQAIEKLTQAIQKNPSNKDAYLERSFAYFELGKFDLAINDFLQIDEKFNPIQSKDKISLNFAKGLIFGLIKGGRDMTIEFIPSTLASLYGLGNGLWAFVLKPIDCSKEMVSACQHCIKFIKENTSVDITKELVPELKTLINNWDSINDEKKGNLTGYIIGKYGIDILMTYGSIKALKYYKNLKKANAILTLGTLSKDTKKAQIIFKEAVKKHEKVETITKTFDLAKINSRIYLQLEKQFLKDGKESIYKGLAKAEQTLQQHKDKLPILKYKSQVQGTIKNIESQIETIKKFIRDKGLNK